MTDIERALRRLPSPGFAERLTGSLRERAAQLAPTTVVERGRVGVIADTHCRRADDLPEGVLAALAGVAVIVHCGDIGSVDLLARLEGVAPVVAVRSGGDEPADGVRLFEGPRLIRAGRRLLGVVSHLEGPPDSEALFGTEVDGILTGTTHIAEIRPLQAAGDRQLVLVNPGSPTLPADGNPTVAIVDCDGDQLIARIVSIEKPTEELESIDD